MDVKNTGYLLLMDLTLETIDELEKNESILGMVVKSKILGDRGNYYLAMSLINEIVEYNHQCYEIKDSIYFVKSIQDLGVVIFVSPINGAFINYYCVYIKYVDL